MASSFSFNAAQSTLRAALKFENYFRTSTLRKLRKITQWVFLAAFLAFLLTFIPGGGIVSPTVSRLLLAAALLTFSYGTTILLLERFGEYLKAPKVPLVRHNLANAVSFEVAKAAHLAATYAKRKNFMQVDSTLLLYFLLKENASIEFIFARALLNFNEFKKDVQRLLSSQVRHPGKVKETVYAPDFEESITKSIAYAQEKGRQRAEIEDLFAALANTNQFFNRFLIEHNFLPERDMARIADWHYRLRVEAATRKKFWLKNSLRRYGTMGKDWAAGYTITLDQFSYDISDEVRTLRFPRAVGHIQEKEMMARILSRQQMNNVLLVGNPGTGRKRLIQDFASKSVLGEHESPLLNYQRVVELELTHLLAGLQSLEEAEAALNQIFKEVGAAGNTILVIDEFHNFTGEGLEQAAGRVNIAGVLASYLRNDRFPFIAATTFAGLHRYLEQNPSLLSLFEVVEMSELSQEETLSVLEEVVPSFEGVYRKFVSFPALQAIVAYADRYIQAVPFPKKAIDLLDEAMGYLATTSESILLPSHIALVVQERTQIPVGDIEGSEREVLLDLENLIHKRIINQEEAVKEVASALRRARTDIATRKGPMGSFLFMGPTGVGKTETAKALAAIYFGSEKRIIRLDMSEFQNVQDVERLLGTATQEGLLTSAVREDPFSLVLLDELEKAHPNILNLFLQVLDEGHITDGLGRKTDFRHTIIIATSNAGYQLILEAVKTNADFAQLKQQLLDFVFSQGIYRPEFINRFDGVILFTPLSKQHLMKIAGLMLQKLQSNLREKGIDFVITLPLKERIAELGYNPAFGARNMRRVLQDKVENAVAVAILSNTLRRGDRVTVDPGTFAVNHV